MIQPKIRVRHRDVGRHVACSSGPYMTHALVSLTVGFGIALSALACGGSGAPVGIVPATDGGVRTGSGATDAALGPGAPDAAVDEEAAAPTDDAGMSVTEAGASNDASADAGASAPFARVAIPMYVDPSDGPTLWSEVFAAGTAAGLLVMNPDNGPDPEVDPAYTNVVSSSHAAGQIVIGYVHSMSAQRAIADVEADVDTYYAQYPGIDGIFVDEVSDKVSTVSSYYVPLYTHIKGKAKSATVVINPGTMVDESFMTATDVLLSWEDTYADYVNPSVNSSLPAWVKKYPASRFWNIIHTTPAGSEADAIARARSANVGWIYVTAEGPDTAYQKIETGSYWTTELSLVTAP